MSRPVDSLAFVVGLFAILSVTALAQLPDMDTPTHPLGKARVMGLSLGMPLEEVKAKLGNDWRGQLGNPLGRERGRFGLLSPVDEAPYDAQLVPPEGTTYLDKKLEYLNLYFLPEDGEFKLYAIAFGLDDSPERLKKILTKQFGNMTYSGGWSFKSRSLMLVGTEVLLFDESKRGKAEGWFITNRALRR